MQSNVRLINANAADVERICCYYGDNCRIEDVQEWLDEQPTVEANLVVHGKWLPTDYDAHKCSECGGREDYWWADKGTPFCPYCGAKMESESNDSA